MMFFPTEEEAVRNDKLSTEAELKLNEDDARKDLKEQRAITKQTMYEGSKKLKHILPKGKHQ
jgi:hypothetical protein